MFRLITIALLSMAAWSANAALLGRAPITPAGTDYQAYYDDILNITWLANANLANTNTFGVTGIQSGGWMTWPKATEWIAAMNAASYLGANNWRMPVAIDTGLPGCTSFANGGTDCGWNTDPAAGEMAHLYFVTLGNISAIATNGASTGCGLAAPGYCLTNTGPFQNLSPSLDTYYWYGTTYAPDPTNAWAFYFGLGYQGPDDKVDGCCYRVWAVQDGDPFAVQSAVPIPAAFWLFGGAVGALGLVRRRVAG